jgi:NADH-quinone oxidoreductase subunit N
MDALILLFATGLVALFAGFAKKPGLVLGIAVAGGVATIASLLNGIYTNTWVLHLVKYKGLSFEGTPTLLLCVALVTMTILVSLMAYSRFKEQLNHTGDYIGLMFFSACGGLMMITSTDLFMFFIALEILSIPVYVLVGSSKSDVRSTEASLKYFLMGAFATGIFLFGVAWIYGATKSFDLAEIAMSAGAESTNQTMLWLGVIFVLVAFLFKIGSAPFHFWGPDVYDGAPNPITAFMSSSVKLAGFYGFWKLIALFTLQGERGSSLIFLLTIVAIISMVIGNFSALKQTKLKRLLAFSSIVHMGFMLMIFSCSYAYVVEQILFYFSSYAASVIGLLAVANVINDKEDRIEAFNGLGKRNPFMAFVAVISILSMAGVPPTAGFFAKYFLFSDVWAKAPWLVIIALITSAIGIYYYLKMIIAVLTPSIEQREKLRVDLPSLLAMIVCVIVTLGLSFYTAYLMAPATGSTGIIGH